MTISIYKGMLEKSMTRRKRYDYLSSQRIRVAVHLKSKSNGRVAGKEE